MDDITTIIWEELKDYEDLYEISEYGDIKNKKGNILSKHIRNGYYACQLNKNGKGKTISIHRLVALNFLEKPNSVDKNTINHIDGNKLNNHYSNLEWVTSSENCKHATKSGLKNNKVLPVLQFSLDNTFIEEFASISEASKKTGTADNKISLVCKNKRKTAGGFIWKYKDENLSKQIEIDEVDGVEIKDFPSYMVTKDGKVYSKSFKKFIATRINGKHVYVTLYNKGYKKDEALAHIVARAYIPNINNYPYVIHKDKDHSNNKIENLEWTNPTITMKKYYETK